MISQYGKVSAPKDKPDRASAQVWALYPDAVAIWIRYGHRGWWKYVAWLKDEEVA